MSKKKIGIILNQDDDDDERGGRTLKNKMNYKVLELHCREKNKEKRLANQNDNKNY